MKIKYKDLDRFAQFLKCEQDYYCVVCDEELDDRSRLIHDEDTGEFLGVVHKRCNKIQKLLREGYNYYNNENLQRLMDWEDCNEAVIRLNVQRMYENSYKNYKHPKKCYHR